DHQGMLTRLKKHEEVVTSGGMFGMVVNVKTETVTLRIDENVRVEVEKSSITRLVKSRGADGEPSSLEPRA
ncbi:MAG: preprotein translocase subunit YajC, partial [Candidatus Omnitrophica bacterium]|nr:preprotein translocase subunit YajC [Candidatus Omnitrophota bacterium]